MKKDIEKLLASIDEKHFEVVSELGRLDEEMVEKLNFPGKPAIEKTVAESVSKLANGEHQSETDHSKLSTLWADLVKELEIWEQDHPRITMVVGDIARALAAAGL